MKPREQGDRYTSAVSGEALQRQVDLGRHRFLCCGELKHEGHHPHCSNRPPDPVEIHPEQTQLV